MSLISFSLSFFFLSPQSRNSTQHGAGGDAGPSSDQVANYFKALRRSRLCCRRRTFAGRHHPYRRCLRLLLPLCRYDFATSKMPGVIDPPTPNARNQFHGQKEMGTCAVDAFEIKMIVWYKEKKKEEEDKKKKTKEEKFNQYLGTQISRRQQQSSVLDRCRRTVRAEGRMDGCYQLLTIRMIGSGVVVRRNADPATHRQSP